MCNFTHRQVCYLKNGCRFMPYNTEILIKSFHVIPTKKKKSLLIFFREGESMSGRGGTGRGGERTLNRLSVQPSLGLNPMIVAAIVT